MRNHHLYRSFKSEESPSKQRTHTAHETIKNPSCFQNEKKFFDIEYIFEDPMATKRRRYHVEPRTTINRNSQKKYKTLQPKADLTTSVILKADDNLLKIHPIKEKQLFHMQKTDLLFNRNSKRDSIHARKLTDNSSIFRSLSSRKTERSSTIQNKSFQHFLSTKNYSAHQEPPSIEKQRKRSKVQRQIKKLQSHDSKEQSRANKKGLKIESDEFRKYCEKNIEFAKNAFLLKNKQTIRIYRPWSPINLEEGFQDYQFGGPS